MITASALSVVSIITQGGGALYQPLFGWILESSWDNTLSGGVPVYSYTDYNNALLLLVAGFAVAIIALLLIKETNGKRIK